MPQQAGLPDELAEATRMGAEALFALFSRRLQNEAGLVLLTILVPGQGGRQLYRLYSSDEANYPLGPADVVEDTAWFRHLFCRAQPVVANNEAEIAAWLPEFRTYAAQGYGALANLPIVVGKRVIGIVNIMASRGHFTSERLRAMRSDLPLAALAVLVRQVNPAVIVLP